MRAKKVQSVETVPEMPMKILTDPLEIRQLLDRAAEGTVAIDVQIKAHDGRKFRFKLLDQPTRGEFLHVDVGGSSKELSEFKSQLQAHPSLDCLLLIFLKGRFLIGLTSEPEFDRGSGLRFRIPPRICRIQRRKEARYQVPAGYDISVEMRAIEGAARLVKKPLFDLSRSGLGFSVLSPREAGLFKPGTVLEKLRFTVHGRTILADAVVRSRIPADSKTGRPAVIGTEFIALKPADELFITEFIALQVTRFMA